MGMLSAALFFVISHAKPLEHMSADRPHTMIFSLYVFASITGQFVIHMGYLIIMYNGALSAMPEVSKFSTLATFTSAVAWQSDACRDCTCKAASVMCDALDPQTLQVSVPLCS